MADNNNCKKCDTPFRLQSIGSVTGSEGQLTIEIADFPALVCDGGHRQFVSQGFPMQLLGQVAGENNTGLPVGEKKGLLFKKHHCGKCGEVLPAQGESRSFSFDVQLKDLPQKIHAALTLPVYKCASCGQEQLRDIEDIEEFAPAALAHAFQAAGIKPMG